jgi:hypothetical protein
VKLKASRVEEVGLSGPSLSYRHRRAGIEFDIKLAFSPRQICASSY